VREAVLLVGGQGTRLRPLTLTTPKPLLPVGGVPFVTHQIAALRTAGVDHIVLATAYRAEVFESEFGAGESLGVRITYVHEDEPLGTGGAIGHAAAKLMSSEDDPVVVLNGDILSGHDVAAQVAGHTACDADVTLHLVEVPDARAYGCVPTDDDGRVTAFLEKMPNPVTRWINAGAYVFRRRVIDEIPSGRPISVERETFPDLLERGYQLRGWKDSSYWCDVGTPESLVLCSADVVTGKAPSPAFPGQPGESWLAPGTMVAADAIVNRGTSVLGGVTVGRGSRVEGSILMMNAAIHDDVRVTTSVIGNGATVESGVELTNAVLADGAVVRAGERPPAGARLER
jgi:mannose-1-phosphate guanylyltransferase